MIPGGFFDVSHPVTHLFSSVDAFTLCRCLTGNPEEGSRFPETAPFFVSVCFEDFKKMGRQFIFQ
jgi:hypothetical protein